MVGVYGLAYPAHRVGGAQAIEDIVVVQDRLHQDILVHARSGTHDRWPDRRRRRNQPNDVLLAKT